SEGQRYEFTIPLAENCGTVKVPKYRHRGNGSSALREFPLSARECVAVRRERQFSTPSGKLTNGGRKRCSGWRVPGGLSACAMKESCGKLGQPRTRRNSLRRGNQ